ncbi:MAG TPA: hypothetical protein VHW64_08935 [Nocardioides sp.]|jgi:hypothetical protein|uniref:hypothetical protein n=1 Tax=Nocardioides sp. TaxID=35761 RepID=UPI002E34F520|nr:hypothetical protein [Nocardioides sp.]HEX3930816.1 hypothetical protein [Nocardioides sp.]
MTRHATHAGESADEQADGTSTDRTAQAKAAANAVRARVAQVAWILCALAALVLAAGALCIALRANSDNSLVKFCVDNADRLDLGVFSRVDGVAHWKGHSHAALTKNALANWGLAAVIWLVAGRVVERIIRPRPSAPAKKG